MNKQQLIKWLKSLEIYQDYYGGPVIDEIIDELDHWNG